jgi:hypothetical protein
MLSAAQFRMQVFGPNGLSMDYYPLARRSAAAPVFATHLQGLQA